MPSPCVHLFLGGHILHTASLNRTGARNFALTFDEWTETFGSERLTGALLDRLTHHVSILEMNGESYRLAHSRARKAKSNP